MEAESIQRRSPESAPVRAKWDLAKALLPLFHDEKSLPTTENADQRRYEYLADDGDDEGRSDTSSATSNKSFPKLAALRQYQRRISPNGSVSEEVVRFVNFPRDAPRIESCQRSAAQFYVALKNLDPSTKSFQAVTQYTPRDVDALKHAHGFASTCTSLFSQMVGGNMCATPYRAKLHLSGFKEEQLEMSIETCGKMDWISAIFTRYRKLAIALLAACMFQLSDSPWIDQHLGPESIFVPVPLPQTNIGTQHWCPRVVCSLVPDIKARPGLQSENIAAFGVLMLELETQSKANWEDGDENYDTGEMSNNVRLARVLKSRKDDVDDDCNKIANVCLQFDKLVEILEHPDIDHKSKGLAVIYKYILEPLFRHVATKFGILEPIFDGIFTADHSLTAPTKFSSSVTARRELFDDDESTARPGDINSAKKFLGELQPFFTIIRDLSRREFTIGSPLAKNSTEKVRIAVLDSGVDGDDAMIKSAIKFRRININKKPGAEIYVAKICTGKVINNEFMPGIAQTINWAVKECKADIISMSFGFEEADEAIEMAVEDATQAGKLVIAAASNNGRRSGRARPARRDDVVCIHATDGNGKQSGMNPSPVPETDNFATLEVAVPSRRNNEDVWKSGTSFAVPVAAGFAADPGNRHNFRGKRVNITCPPSAAVHHHHHPLSSSSFSVQPAYSHDELRQRQCRRAEGLKKQQPTYFVAPNFTTRPFPDGPLDLGTLVEDLESCYPINQGSSPSNRVPIPEGQRYTDTKEDIRAAVKTSAGAEASVLAKVLDRSVGGDASLRGQKSDEEVYTFRALDTVYFYPTPSYIKQCLQLRDVKEYSDMADYQAPLYLITGLKIACGATISTDRSREYEGSA
ncbi:pfs domain-containing protein [Colletotrichum sojae]|uniref:Pfs domain-containing protein n=1 Tax=Colletotrichum sojae TaxID=2175907 RepID=A0A8H6JDA5_9PEZI|nr:pfs domain-containing protein [Colletotrichum sojae]